MAADFDVIRKLVERKHVELKDKIESIYDDNLRSAYRYIDGLSAIKQTIETVMTEGDNNKMDIDQLRINNVLTKLLAEIQTEFDFDVQTAELDLIDSKFIHEPFQRIEKALVKYDYMPIKHADIADIQKQFMLGGTKILFPELITAEFLVEVMPRVDD